MHGEISKGVRGKKIEQKHFETVNMQMGRVQLDSDWNEAFESMHVAGARHLTDVVGAAGSPNDGFAVGHALTLDHMEYKRPWTLSGSALWEVEHMEFLEGTGSFRLEGEGTLSRKLPELLKRLDTLREVLIARNLTAATPKLILYYKVMALEGATMTLSVIDLSGSDITTGEIFYPCTTGNWQVIELPLVPDLSVFEKISISVASKGIVYLDRLALDPGLIADNAHDFYVQGGYGESEGAGRFYVDGLACVKEGFETYLSQKDYPEAPSINLDSESYKLVYLDVWMRTVTAVEDPDILEDALGGPDTCTREQLVAQVKVKSTATLSCAVDIDGLVRSHKTGLLTAALSPKSEQQKCDFRPDKDYTGLDNSLYRIEINEAASYQTATFKWSRNNGADLAAIIAFDSDNHSVVVADDRGLCCGDIVELCDDVSDLADFGDHAKHGKLASISALEHIDTGVKITLDTSTNPMKGRSGMHPKLRKWNGKGLVKDYLVFEADGVTPAKELEHGIRLAFSQDWFYHGDYWQFTARVNSRSIEALDKAPPAGPEHHYASLAGVVKQSASPAFESCRKVFPALTELSAMQIAFDPAGISIMTDKGVVNVQQAIEILAAHEGIADEIVAPGMSIAEAIERLGDEGGSVYLCPGVHVVRETIKISSRKNITIWGDRAATGVLYLPKPGGEALRLMKYLREETGKIKESIKVEKAAGNRDRLRELKKDLADMTGKLSRAEKDAHDDLFRIESSRDIFFERFLMLTLDADSLVAVLEGSRSVGVKDCDIFNLSDATKVRVVKRMASEMDRIESGTRIGEATETDVMPYEGEAAHAGDIDNSDEVTNPEGAEHDVDGTSQEDRKLYPACIRFTGCCDVVVEENRLTADIGLLQQGFAAQTPSMPLVDGLRCRANDFRIGRAAVVIIEGVRVVIADNRILAAAASIGKEEAAVIEKLIEEALTLDGDCPLRTEKVIYELIDALIDALFKCLTAMGVYYDRRSRAVMAFALRDSAIEGNGIASATGLWNFFSENTRVCSNAIKSTGISLDVGYSFQSEIRGNDLFRVEKPKAAKDDAIEKKEENTTDIEAEKKTEGTASTAHYGLTMNESVMVDGQMTAGNIGGLFQSGRPQALVDCHFADRLSLEGNRLEGVIGYAMETLAADDFLSVLDLYATLWPERLKDDAALLLAKRFASLMGLDPTIHLIETVMGCFYHGIAIDFTGLFLAGIAGKDDSGEYEKLLANPFVKMILRIFKGLLSTSLFSRSVIAKNRFDVEEYGIYIKNIVQLGGARFMKNRINGAAEEAILWQAMTLFSNTELNGTLLSNGYDILVKVLKLVVYFLEKLLELIEDESTTDETISPFLVLAFSILLYGVGQTCPLTGDGTDSGSTTTIPDNPFEDAIKAIIEAVTGLIDQLENDHLADQVADLSTSDERIAFNGIRGAGNGIDTNIANCIIESNRIDIENGSAAVAEIFALGHYLSTHAKVIDDKDDTGVVRDHSAVVEMGVAFMSMNPLAIRAAAKNLAAKADQWNGLAEVFQDMGSTGVAAIDGKIKVLYDLIAAGTASQETLKGPSSALVVEALRDLKGFGMILESLGVQVLRNRVEALGQEIAGMLGMRDYASPKAGAQEGVNFLQKETGVRPAPGGIIVTGGALDAGATDYASLIMNMLIMEEFIPFYNLGGQGTHLFGNSIQWGTGHGISFSRLATAVDVKVEENEIQNHGLAGLLMIPFMSYDVSVMGNEINQCFLNPVTGADLSKIAMPTHLGGIMIARGVQIHCSSNLIRSTGRKEGSWPAYGAVFYDCANVVFTDNDLVTNGLTAKSQENEFYLSSGGAILWGGSGTICVNNNRFERNVGKTLFIGYYLSYRYDFAGMNISIALDPFITRQIERVQVVGNQIGITDVKPSYPAKIWVGDQGIPELLFASNQVSHTNFEDSDWPATSLYGMQLLFNSNQFSCGASVPPVALWSAKGVAIGNLLHKDLYISGAVAKDHNIF